MCFCISLFVCVLHVKSFGKTASDKSEQFTGCGLFPDFCDARGFDKEDVARADVQRHQHLSP